MENYDYDDIDLDRRMNNGQLDRRYFCTLAIAHVEGLSLSMSHMDMIKSDFEAASCKFIRWQISQTNQLLHQLVDMI
jgi:hypothetical protein